MQNDKRRATGKNTYLLVDVVLLVVFTCAIYFLLYQQTQYKQEVGLYQADLVDHINTALSGKGYSLISASFRWIYACVPSIHGIVAFLVLVSLLTVFLIAFAIDKWTSIDGKGGCEWYMYVPLAITCTILTSIYIPFVYPYFYNGTCLTQPWHNSTYLLMRCLGMLVMIVYFQIEEHYLEHISLKQMVIFTILLALVNYAKPNFIIGFAPMMLIYLVQDFVRTRGKSCVQNVKFGICVLASLPILYVQSTILYPAGGESKIVFTLENVINGLKNGQLFSIPIAGLVFPIVITLMLKRKGRLSKKMRQSWVMWIISWGEKLFLTETGYRMYHGNFGWGCRFFSVFLVVVCIAEWIHVYKRHVLSRKEFLAGSFCLLLNILCSIYYFCYLLTGQLYTI